jgi:hypothetical protein
MSIARLPREAALKFAAMRDETEEANNARLSIQRRISETENQIRHTNHETDAARVAALQEEIKRQTGRRDIQEHRFLTLNRRLVGITTWLNQIAPNVVLVDAPAPENPGGGKLGEAGVDHCRDEIHRLTDARKHVARAVLPLDALLAQVDGYVEAMAKRGAPIIAMDRDQLSVRHSFDGFGSSPANTVAILAWLFGDEMRQRLRDDAMAIREEKERHLPVMTPEARKSKLRELDARILAAERDEEALICEAAECGQSIERRENASPAAVLGVEVVHPGASATASGAVLTTNLSLVLGKATGSAAKARSA